MDTPAGGASRAGDTSRQQVTPRTPGKAAATERTAGNATARSGADADAADADGSYGSDCVRIGDIVFLHGVDVQGLLFADGFVDECVWLGQATRDNDHELIMDSLFIIQVRNFHTATERLKQLEHQLEHIGDEHYQDAQLMRAQLPQMKAAVEEELAANERERQRSLGAVVRYGDGIELKHLKSGKMLSIQVRLQTGGRLSLKGEHCSPLQLQLLSSSPAYPNSSPTHPVSS
jgi:hypothetical protein